MNTPEPPMNREEAFRCHDDIIFNFAKSQDYKANSRRHLFVMKERHGYLHFGCNSVEEYAEKLLHIKDRYCRCLIRATEIERRFGTIVPNHVPLIEGHLRALSKYPETAWQAIYTEAVSNISGSSLKADLLHQAASRLSIPKEVRGRAPSIRKVEDTAPMKLEYSYSRKEGLFNMIGVFEGQRGKAQIPVKDILAELPPAIIQEHLHSLSGQARCPKRKDVQGSNTIILPCTESPELDDASDPFDGC